MSEVIVTYKGLDKDFKCRGMQYEEGGSYESDDAIRCGSKGFHSCINPFDVWNYYPAHNSRYAKTEASGKIDKCNDDTKIASSKLHVVAEIGLPGFIKAAIDFIWEQCKPGEVNTETILTNDEHNAQIGSSGNYAKIGSSGNSAQIGSSGDYAKIGSSGNSAKIGSSGDYAQIGSSGNYAKIGSSGNSAQIGSSGNSAQIGSSGNYAKIGSSGNYAKIGSSGNSAQIGSSGDYAKIGSSGNSAQIGSSGNYAKIGSSGDYAQIGSSGNYAKIGSSGNYAKIDITGQYSVGMCAGHNSKIKAQLGCWITLAEWKYDEKLDKAIPVCVKSAQIDGVTLKEDTWYMLACGEFVEVGENE